MDWFHQKARYGIARRGRRPKPVPKGPSYRVNRRIRVPNLRVIGGDGENLGVMTTHDALDLAQESGLDLVEVAPTADPPVARIMDYGKFSYEQTKRERAARKQQKSVEVKEIRFTIDTGEFHRDIKVRNARRWLGEGKKVKVSIRFKGREITRPEIGRGVMTLIAAELEDISSVEQHPNLEGRRMIMLLAPLG